MSALSPSIGLSIAVDVFSCLSVPSWALAPLALLVGRFHHIGHVFRRFLCLSLSVSVLLSSAARSAVASLDGVLLLCHCWQRMAVLRTPQCGVALLLLCLQWCSFLLCRCGRRATSFAACAIPGESLLVSSSILLLVALCRGVSWCRVSRADAPDFNLSTCTWLCTIFPVWKCCNLYTLYGA